MLFHESCTLGWSKSLPCPPYMWIDKCTTMKVPVINNDPLVLNFTDLEVLSMADGGRFFISLLIFYWTVNIITLLFFGEMACI